MSSCVYTVSDRHRKAVEVLGKETVRMAMRELQNDPNAMQKENIGVSEREMSLHLPLSDEDLDLLDYLTRQLGMNSASAVVRQAVERAIAKSRLTQFYKPQGWESRPLHISQVGSEGKNPVSGRQREGKGVYQRVAMPPSLVRKIESVARNRTAERGLSAIARRAIDAYEGEELEPVPPSDAYGTATKDFWIEERHAEKLSRYGNRSAVLRSLLNREVERLAPRILVLAGRSAQYVEWLASHPDASNTLWIQEDTEPREGDTLVFADGWWLHPLAKDERFRQIPRYRDPIPVE